MSKLIKGSRVGMIENGKIVKGTVKEVYFEVGYAVVEFDCETTRKVLLSNLAVLPEESQEPKSPTEPVEKSEITITPEEFENIAGKVGAKLAFKFGPDFILKSAILMAKLHEALFIEGDNE